MGSVFFCGANDEGLPASLASELTVIEVVVATILALNTGRNDSEFLAMVCGVCRRDVSMAELHRVVGRLCVLGLITAEGDLGSRHLTFPAFAVVRDAHDCLCRLIDNDLSAPVEGADVGLFGNWDKE